MKLIVGLGNPGLQYQNTRHNVGFIVVESFFENWKLDKKFKALIATESTISPGVIGAKPETFMNLSGDAIAAIVSFYKLDPKSDILVISDDIDMEFGKVRYRSQGSHGGQNGLRDSITKLGTSEFARIKVGIGRDDRYSVSDWVLSRFTQDELDTIQNQTIAQVQEYIKKWLGE